MPQGSSAWVWMSIAVTFSISGSLSFGISGFPGLIFQFRKLIILYNKFRKAAEIKPLEGGGSHADYNGQRPHSSLQYLTPAAYAATFTATGARLRNPDQLRRSPVAPPAPHGLQKTETLIASGLKFGGRSQAIEILKFCTMGLACCSP